MPIAAAGLSAALEGTDPRVSPPWAPSSPLDRYLAWLLTAALVSAPLWGVMLVLAFSGGLEPGLRLLAFVVSALAGAAYFASRRRADTIRQVGIGGFLMWVVLAAGAGVIWPVLGAVGSLAAGAAAASLAVLRLQRQVGVYP